MHGNSLAIGAHMRAFTRNPLAHARFTYRWGEGALKGVLGPREWQREVMEVIGKHLDNPETRHTPCRIARASGHGIGKSALIAMLIKWGLDTGVDTRVVITANTETQLEKKQHMKARGLASPDDADALALTFAEPVMPREEWPEIYRQVRELTEEEEAAELYAELFPDRWR
ncbi:hypothetical protein [Sphingomonas sp.]|uniref:hypothetical protein n=1 Tax=Sphingomonas sp. TaxID=28214 RepID=UPI003D6D321F